MKSRFHLPSYIAGILVVALFTATVAGATGALQEISSIIDKRITMSWNWESFIPKDDVTGQKLYPIIYNGRSYLSARYVAEAAGLKPSYPTRRWKRH